MVVGCLCLTPPEPTYDERTTETIWTAFHRPLLAFIRRVADPDPAQDLRQDVFVQIHLKLPTLTQADKLASWVYPITRHCLLEYQKARRGVVKLTGDQLPGIEAGGAVENSAAGRVLQKAGCPSKAVNGRSCLTAARGSTTPFLPANNR